MLAASLGGCCLRGSAVLGYICKFVGGVTRTVMWYLNQKAQLDAEVRSLLKVQTEGLTAAFKRASLLVPESVEHVQGH